MESHHCRQSTSKDYFEPVWLTFNSLYRFYESECKNNDEIPLSYKTFSEVFKSLNISLFLPKKDKCNICCGHSAGNVSVEEYNQHVSKNIKARVEKEIDKTGVGGIHAYNMDLQKFHLVPSLNTLAVYYKTKLLVHNFTLFDLKAKDVYCYLWHESEGRITSNEFSSIVCFFISSKSGVNSNEIVNLYSDGCTYQNINSTLSNAVFNLSQEMNIIVIQTNLERGHTQMECDNMHSTIERKLKNREIYTPASYVNICKSARDSPKPYDVMYANHSFFKDYSDLSFVSSIRPGLNVGDPCVTDIKAIRYSSDGIHVKVDFEGEWKILPTKMVW
ncbi:hypothetical protein PR048_008675 [Dryococelus australis]|uniref:Uncharacterized protein n=1 Tax=Dryococelus australis TaxID=614101 RepID=A0ABQ9HXS7_9NEOP|nr:hypothetical protein PR048_008675 [Dryococelus australis]